MTKTYNKKSNEEKNKEVNELIEIANKGIEECFDSPEQLKEMANYMGKFYRYSFRNTLLIQNQFIGAAAVGSYGFWKEKGFTVNKGEKGIKILAPVKLGDRFEDAEGEVKLISKASEKEKSLIKSGQLKFIEGRMSFKQGYVFEITQTNAKAEDLPKIFPNKWLEGDVKNYDLMYKAMENIAKKIGVKIIEPQHELGVAKGASYPLTKEVALNPRNTQMQNVKTLIHELAHAKLHTMETRDNYTSNAKEFQAELTAYVVCNYFGLDTSEYSFRYIKEWTKDVELKDKEQLVNEVRETVKEYIEVIEDTLTQDKDLISEKSNESIQDKANINENDKELYKVMEQEVSSEYAVDVIDRDKEYSTLVNLEFEDGSFIKMGTKFLVEGFEEGKYELHFETREDNVYIPNDSCGDGYYFTLDEIVKFSDLTKGHEFIDLTEGEEWKLTDDEFKELDLNIMKDKIYKLIESDYGMFINALVSIETGVEDLEVLDKVYQEYMDKDFTLLNDEINHSINKLKENGVEEEMLSEVKEKEIWKKIREHEEWINSNGLRGKQLNLENENLRGMRLLNLDLRDSNFKNADVRECIIFADLRGSNFTGAKIDKTEWVGSNVNNITIEANKLNLIEYQIEQEKDVHMKGLGELKTNKNEKEMKM